MPANNKKKKKQLPSLPAPRLIGRGLQPVDSVVWVDRNELHANSYNPNHVAPIEMTLLKISLLEDGWTQPIVARPDGEIVDGFHRWTCSSDSLIASMTNNLVPVVYLTNIEKEHQIMSTIRHNRAKGSHGILKMAEIVRTLVDDEGMSRQEVQVRLQMDEEEIERLYDRAGVLKYGEAQQSFSEGWVPAENTWQQEAKSLFSDKEKVHE